jgi:hypothetical protein
MPGSDHRALAADIAAQCGEPINGKLRLNSLELATFVFLRHRTFPENEGNIAELHKHGLAN